MQDQHWAEMMDTVNSKELLSLLMMFSMGVDVPKSDYKLMARCLSVVGAEIRLRKVRQELLEKELADD